MENKRKKTSILIKATFAIIFLIVVSCSHFASHIKMTNQSIDLYGTICYWENSISENTYKMLKISKGKEIFKVQSAISGSISPGNEYLSILSQTKDDSLQILLFNLDLLKPVLSKNFIKISDTDVISVRDIAWNHKGTKVAFILSIFDGKQEINDLFIFNIEKSELNIALLNTNKALSSISWSPDDRKLVLVSKIRGDEFLVRDVMKDYSSLSNKFDQQIDILLYCPNSKSVEIIFQMDNSPVQQIGWLDNQRILMVNHIDEGMYVIDTYTDNEIKILEDDGIIREFLIDRRNENIYYTLKFKNGYYSIELFDLRANTKNCLLMFLFPIYDLKLSPTGKLMGFTSKTNLRRIDVYVLNLKDKTYCNVSQNTRFPIEDWGFLPGPPAFFEWIMGDRFIVHSSYRMDRYDLYISSCDGSWENRITNTKVREYSPYWIE